MTMLAFAFGLLLAALGGLGIVSPDRLLALVRSLQTPAGLYGIAALRLVMGATFLWAAPVSKAPQLLGILGVITILAGLATPLFGLERFRKLLDWWGSQGPVFIRLWATLPLALGLYLAWAVLPGA